MYKEAKSADASSPVQSAINDISGIIGAIKENLADLAEMLGPVLRPDLVDEVGKNDDPHEAFSCEMEASLRSKAKALAIINSAIINLTRRIAL